MTILGNRIKELRNSKKISQAELGKRIGVGKTTISNYETGYSAPDNETLKKIADVLSTTTDYLLGRTDNPSLNESKLELDLGSAKLNKIARYAKDLTESDQDAVLRVVQALRRAKSKDDRNDDPDIL